MIFHNAAPILVIALTVTRGLIAKLIGTNAGQIPVLMVAHAMTALPHIIAPAPTVS